MYLLFVMGGPAQMGRIVKVFSIPDKNVGTDTKADNYVARLWVTKYFTKVLNFIKRRYFTK